MYEQYRPPEHFWTQCTTEQETSNFYYRMVFFIPDWLVMIKYKDILKILF